MDHQQQLCAAVGMFDGVHLGHRSIISRLCAEARQRNLVPAIFTFDIHPLEIVAPQRAPRLVCSLPERVRQLHHAGASRVEVLPFDDALRNLSAEEFMTMLRDRFGVSTLVVGFNHRFGRGASGSFDEYREIGNRLGIEVISADECDKPGISSTAIRHMLMKGYVDNANALLGRRFRLTGIVENGKRLGRTLGFPTANLRIDTRMMLPAPGVYAAVATLPDASQYPAMVNIGVRPTVDKTPSPATSVEAHVIGFDGDLYGKEISLDFIAFLRPEQAFPSIEVLRSQLALDRDAALKAINSCPTKQ